MTRRGKRKTVKDKDPSEQQNETAKSPTPAKVSKTVDDRALTTETAKSKQTDSKAVNSKTESVPVEKSSKKTHKSPRRVEEPKGVNNNATIDVSRQLENIPIDILKSKANSEPRPSAKNFLKDLELKAVKRKLDFSAPAARGVKNSRKILSLQADESISMPNDRDRESGEESTTDDSNSSENESEVEMEISFEANDDEFSDEENSTTEEDSDDEKERGLNRRIAIARMGKKSQKDGSTSNEAVVEKSDNAFTQAHIADWIKSLVSQQMAQQPAVQPDEDREKRKKDKKKKKEKKAEDRSRRMAKYSKKEKKGNVTKTIPADNGAKKTAKKSRSDTTIYVPGLEMINRTRSVLDQDKGKVILTPQLKADITSQVASILSSIKMSDVSVGKRGSEDRWGREDRRAEKTKAPLEAVEEEIIRAEKQKAELAMPKGGYKNKQNDVNVDEAGVPEVDHKACWLDGDFFDLSANVDELLTSKIGKGKFIDSDKLYAIRKSIKGADEDAEKKYQWVHKDGESYWQEVVNKDSKVNNFRKWELGFRIYAQVFSQVNPHRGAEIWQYVDTIQDAASHFQWDNVARYDYNFRQLMEKRPERCWGTTNTQLWTKCMKNPRQLGWQQWAATRKKGKS